MTAQQKADFYLNQARRASSDSACVKALNLSSYWSRVANHQRFAA